MFFRFSFTTTAVCLVLAAGMLRASYWQWTRHLEKQEIVRHVNANLSEEIRPLGELPELAARAGEYAHRRVRVIGRYDFEHEMVLRNRRFQGRAGVHVITPLRAEIDGRAVHVLVNRGFVPLELSRREQRPPYHVAEDASFIGLLKLPVPPRAFFAPHDPDPQPNGPWIDSWIRIDPARMERQLPYRLEPYFVEVMSSIDPVTAEERIVRSEGGREELLVMGLRGSKESAPPPTSFPVPDYETIVPAGRHLGYVWEWAMMAVATLLIGVVLQLRRPRNAPPADPLARPT